MYFYMHVHVDAWKMYVNRFISPYWSKAYSIPEPTTQAVMPCAMAAMWWRPSTAVAFCVPKGHALILVDVERTLVWARTYSKNRYVYKYTVYNIISLYLSIFIYIYDSWWSIDTERRVNGQMHWPPSCRSRWCHCTQEVSSLAGSRAALWELWGSVGGWDDFGMSDTWQGTIKHTPVDWL